MATVRLLSALDSEAGPSALNAFYAPNGTVDFGQAAREDNDGLTLVGPSPANSNNDPQGAFYFLDNGDIPLDAIITNITVGMVHRAQGADLNIPAGNNPFIFQGRILLPSTVGFLAFVFDGHGSGAVDTTSYTTWTKSLPFKDVFSTPWTRADIFDGLTVDGQVEILSFTNPADNGDDIFHQIDQVYLEVTWLSLEGSGFYKSDIPGIPSNVDATLITGTDARPGSPRGIVIAGPWTDDNPLWGHPGHAVVYKNRLLYARGGYTVGTDLPQVFLWNGTSDYELCKVTGVAATPPNCVVTMAMGDGLIYLTTWDGGTTSADVIGRVLRLNPDSGQLTNVGDINSLAGHVPYSLMFHNGELWTATHRSDATSAGLIARIKPETQTAWTVDLDLTATGQKAVLSMASFQGNFYYGSMGTAGTFAVVGQRTPSAVYSVSLTATGGAAANYNGFYAMTVFGDALYASYWNPDGTPVSKIYKFDGSSWTTVFTGSGATNVPYVGLYVDNGSLYAIGCLRDNGVYSGALLVTPDGTTWTNRIANLPLTGEDSVGNPVTLTSRAPVNAFGTISY